MWLEKWQLIQSVFQQCRPQAVFLLCRAATIFSSGVDSREDAPNLGYLLPTSMNTEFLVIYVPCYALGMVQFSCCHVQLFATPWITALQASLSITNSQNSLKLMSIESVMPSNHLIVCHLLLLLPSIFPASGSFPMKSYPGKTVLKCVQGRGNSKWKGPGSGRHLMR